MQTLSPPHDPRARQRVCAHDHAHAHATHTPMPMPMHTPMPMRMPTHTITGARSSIRTARTAFQAFAVADGYGMHGERPSMPWPAVHGSDGSDGRAGGAHGARVPAYGAPAREASAQKLEFECLW